MGVQVASLFAAIGADLSGLNKGLQQAQGKLQSAGKGMQKAGALMTAAVTVPLVALGKKALTMAGDFEQSMGLLGIALRGTGTDMDQVSAYALQMGADTVFGAQDMAEAMTGLAKAGQTWSEIAGDMTGKTGTLVAATNLAAASDLDLASAADAVSIAMATFGLSADDAVSIVDNFVQTADASVSEVGDLTAALVNVGPTAAQFGWNLEDVNTALAILSERGIAGSEAGTALKSMMTNLMRPTDDVTETLREMSVSLYTAEGQMKSLPDIMWDLERAMGGMSEEQRNNTIQTLAGTYGMKAMGTLLAEGGDGWDTMARSISEAATAQEVASAKMGGLNGIMEQLSGSVETLMIGLGTTLMPVIKDLVENHVIPFLDSLSGLNPEMLKWGVVIAGVAAAAGPLLIVLGSLVTVIGAIGLPILAVIAALGLLAAAWATDFGGIRTKTMEVWGAIQPKIAKLVDWLKEKVPQAIATLRAIWEDTLLPALQAGWAWINEHIVPLLKAIGNLVSAVVSKAFEALAGIWQNVVLPNLKKLWEWIDAKIMPALRTLADWISSKVKPAFDGLGRTIDKVAGWVGRLADKIRKLKLPDWMTPGSPMPWEIGLRGVASALKDVDRLMANFGAPSLTLAPIASMAGAGGTRSMHTPAAAGGGGNIIININEPITVRDDRDIDMIADRIARRLRLTGAKPNTYTLGTA